MRRIERPRILGAIALAAVLFALPTRAAASTIVFNSFTGPGSTSSRGVGDSPGSLLSVSADITINFIEVLNNLSGAGSLKFLIFDHATHTLLYESAEKAFADDGGSSTWKSSDFFSFTFLAGTFYDVGAIANVGGSWNFDQISEIQSGITSIVDNPNFSNFASPSAGNHAAADAAVRLLQGTPTAVPEPGTLTLLGLGLAAIGLARRRR